MSDFHPEVFLRAYDELDATLVAAGFPPTSPWWRKQIAKFVRSGRRRWVIRAGRRGGKSTTLCRLAVCWGLWGAWLVPPGDIAVVSFVSVSRDESAQRLRTISAILNALGIPFEQRGDELELDGVRRVLFKTFACTTTAVVGFTSVAVFGDEVARWESRDQMANPAREVIGSLMPTLATQEHGFAVLCSSPWSTDDYHAELFDQGDTRAQVTSFAPTWVANPTISEERTHELEPDARTWQREYGAVPGATVSAALDPQDVAACFGRRPTSNLRGGFVATDASSLLHDDFAWMTGAESASGEIVVVEVGGFGPADCSDLGVVVDAISERAKHWEASVYGDQREAPGLTTLFGQKEIRFVPYDWTEKSKDEAMQLLRRLMRERRLVLPEHDRLRRELTGMKAHLLPSGRIRYATNGLDYASCLVTLMHAVLAGELLSGNELKQMLELHERMYGPPRGARNHRDAFEPPLPHESNFGTRWEGAHGRGFG